eukprot:7356482-Prymnesium_polylepis.1
MAACGCEVGIRSALAGAGDGWGCARVLWMPRKGRCHAAAVCVCVERYGFICGLARARGERCREEMWGGRRGACVWRAERSVADRSEQGRGVHVRGSFWCGSHEGFEVKTLCSSLRVER